MANVRLVTGSRGSLALAGGIGWVRIAVGLVLAVAPKAMLRSPGGDAPSGALVLMTRTVGVRDIVVGVGSVSAARASESGDVGRWVAVGLMSDVLDTVMGGLSTRLVGNVGALRAALIPVPVIVADVWALSMLKESRPRDPARQDAQ